MPATKTTVAIVATVFSVLLSGAALADDDFENAIRQCRAIENSEARLTCYDAVASVVPEATKAPAPVAAAPVAVATAATATTATSEAAAASVAPQAKSVDGMTAATMSADGAGYDAGAAESAAGSVDEAAAESNVKPLTDEIGLERVDPSRQENPEYVARVVRCDKNPQSGQTYFFFDNDQVWKQANYRRLSVGDCDYEVRLSKDTFGYEMHIPSRDRTIRVSRIC